jgi:hypothetical protein
MEKITNKLIQDHKLWIDSDGKEGKCLTLKLVDLRKKDFSGLNLSNANFIECNLRDANFSNCDLRNSNFFYSDLFSVDFRNSDLRCVNLMMTEMCGVKLTGANLYDAELGGAKLSSSGIFSITTMGMTVVLNHPKQIQIGDMIYSPEYWLENTSTIAIKNRQKEDEIEKYRKYIEFAITQIPYYFDENGLVK